jgi:hypothetical protein
VFLPSQADGRYTVQACLQRETGLECTDSATALVTPAVLNAAIGYVKPSNASALFGTSVALSQDGRTLAVGVPGDGSNATGVNGDPDDTSAPGSGAVFVFTHNGTAWQQQAYVKASNTGSSDGFGRALALSADGNSLAVGAPQEGSNATGIDGNQADNSVFFGGAVYVFERSGGQWAQQAYVKSSNTTAFQEFGTRVALAGDGNTLAVGAPLEASNATGIDGNQADQSASSAGAVYVFARSGVSWQQQAYVKASNTDPDDRFGSSLALSNDGNTLAVGAEREKSSATGVDGNQAENTFNTYGAVYAFTRSGGTWVQQAYLKASNTNADMEDDFFGHSLAISGDGQTIAVGAKHEDTLSTGINGNQYSTSDFRDTGAVYVFARSGNTWVQQAYVKATNTGDLDNFGNALALSANGDTLAVAAWQEDGGATGIGGNGNDYSRKGAGAAYVFHRRGGAWQPGRYLKASNTDENDNFGESIALSGDGRTLAVGAPGEDSAATGIGGDQADNAADARGAVYLY